MTIDHLYIPNTWPRRDECDRKVRDTSDGPSYQCGRPKREHLQLVCAKCGDEPTPDEARYTAKLQGTHYRRIQHGVGIPGRRGGSQARECGPWVVASLNADGRKLALDEWRRAKADG